MFGYVTINKEGMSTEEYERFHRYYCGLCHVLKQKYGKRGQAVLTYDMTFLLILLTSLYECETRTETVRCIPYRGKQHEIFINDMTEYAADMNLALAYFKSLDNWQDDGSRSQQIVAKLLESRYRNICTKYRRQCEAMERELKELSFLEKNHGRKPVESGVCWKERAITHLLTAPKEGDADIDSAANCFGRLTAELFVYREDEWRDTLWSMGFSMGKFIYLMDAYDDLEKDRKKGSFNILLTVAGRKDYEDFCHQMLVMTMGDASRKFEMLPLLEEIGILRNIIYSGVWTRYEIINNNKKKKD